MITKLRWNEFRQLGNLELNFQKADGSTYKNIVLAGENGTGKTAILDSVAEFLNLGSIEPFSSIEYIVNSNSYTVTPLDRGGEYGFHARRNNLSQAEAVISRGGKVKQLEIDADSEDIRGYGCAYSRARSGFSTNPVKSTTAMQLDSERHITDVSTDYTAVKQLLVDVYHQDAAEFYELGRKNDTAVYSQFQSKLSRFRDSFNDFFETMRFEDVDSSSGREIEVFFSKHDTRIAIDSLSTGEKQIVFRGASLLKDCNAVRTGVVLIDEPELSMHPKWQAKIFSFYLGLFEESTQIIMATHSEYVIREALKHRDDTLVIVLSDEDGVIRPHRVESPYILPSISSAETNYHAFGVVSSDYHNQLYAYYQSKNNLVSIASCDQAIKNSSHYDSLKHEKISNYKSTVYYTLPTYIRNAIDHPDNGNTYTDEELSKSVKLLIDLCK